jgi:hypothetical protein
MKFQVKKVLIINWLSLPKEIKDIIADWCGFSNDCLVPYSSEFSPCGDNTWKDLTQERLEQYHKDQTETNNYKGDLEQFIKDYGLEVDKFMIEQKLNLDGIEEIFFNISW